MAQRLLSAHLPCHHGLRIGDRIPRNSGTMLGFRWRCLAPRSQNGVAWPSGEVAATCPTGRQIRGRKVGSEKKAKPPQAAAELASHFRPAGRGPGRHEHAGPRNAGQDAQSNDGRGGATMPRHMMKIMFAIIDANGDGTLSFEEVMAIHKRIFNAIDANKDGKVSLEELEAFMRD